MTSIADISIIAAWKLLGGSEPRRCGTSLRSTAFWRDGHGLNVSLDPYKNCFYDHRDGSGGGVLALVELARSFGKTDALRWLHDNCGLQDLHDERTPLERAAARRDARELERFEESLQPSYRAFLRELETRRDELIRDLRQDHDDQHLALTRRLRERDDADAELELAWCYSRIDAMRVALADYVDPEDAAFCIALVNLIAEAR